MRRSSAALLVFLLAGCGDPAADPGGATGADAGSDSGGPDVRLPGTNIPAPPLPEPPGLPECLLVAQPEDLPLEL